MEASRSAHSIASWISTVASPFKGEVLAVRVDQSEPGLARLALQREAMLSLFGFQLESAAIRAGPGPYGASPGARIIAVRPAPADEHTTTGQRGGRRRRGRPPQLPRRPVQGQLPLTIDEPEPEEPALF